MGWVDRRIDRLLERTRRREVPVPIIAPWQEAQPYSLEQVAPDQYGDYLATSNDVYSCAWLRAKNLAKLPVKVKDTAAEVQETGPLVDLLARPNPHWTRRRLIVFTELCMAVWGRGVILVDRGQNASPNAPPRELWPVKPTLVKPIPHPTEYLSGYAYTPPGGGAPIPLAVSEVIEMVYPNPADLYAPLPPMAAVRLAAEVASESMKANRDLFRQGMMVGGFVMPPDATTSYTTEQARELEEMIAHRFSGRQQAHRWQVLRYFLNLKDMAVTPKDAEWVNGANLTFRQVCRGMGVPPPLVGDAEYATLANLTVYERALWEHTLEFESGFIADELTRQLVPAFPGVSAIEFDLGAVVALQEDEQTRWNRQKEQIDRGTLLINEWRHAEGMEPVPWGDAWWAPLGVAPVSGAEPAPSPAPPPSAEEGAARTRRARHPQRHPALNIDVDGLRDDLHGVFARQRDAILQALRQDEATRSATSAAEVPFDVARWADRTRAACHARFVAATERSMISEARMLRLSPEQVARLLTDRATRAAIEGNVQLFAHRITTTTYNAVKSELEHGVRSGETLDQLASRVVDVMGGRESDARRIAQSEVTRSQTTGQMAAFKVAGVEGKTWTTMGDNDVRDTHIVMDGITIPVDEEFQVGDGFGYGPGQIGLPEEDINCRCWLEPVEALAETERKAGNGKVTVADLTALREALEATTP